MFIGGPKVTTTNGHKLPFGEELTLTGQAATVGLSAVATGAAVVVSVLEVSV
ncbi:MAG: hypothetical protein ACRENL_02770 [Candidatus Dormibacteria bacterium]